MTNTEPAFSGYEPPTLEQKMSHPKTLAVKRFLGEERFNSELERVGIDTLVYCMTTLYDLTNPVTGKY